MNELTRPKRLHGCSTSFSWLLQKEATSKKQRLSQKQDAITHSCHLFYHHTCLIILVQEQSPGTQRWPSGTVVDDILPWFSETAERWECCRNKWMSVISKVWYKLVQVKSRRRIYKLQGANNLMCGISECFGLFCLNALPAALPSEASEYCHRQNCWGKHSMCSAPVTELVHYQPPPLSVVGYHFQKGLEWDERSWVFLENKRERKIQKKKSGAGIRTDWEKAGGYRESFNRFVKKPFLPLPHPAKIAPKCFTITSLKQCHFHTARLRNENVCGLQLQSLFVHIDLSEEVSSQTQISFHSNCSFPYETLNEDLSTAGTKSLRNRLSKFFTAPVSHVALKPSLYLQGKRPSIHFSHPLSHSCSTNTYCTTSTCYSLSNQDWEANSGYN